MEYKQIPATIDGSFFPEHFAMCSVTPTTREATLAQELLYRGVGAATSSLEDLQASGGEPSEGFFEPRPSVKLVDLDSDGLADLVVSVRLSGVKRHFNCDGTKLEQPEPFEPSTTTVVFRNTGSGWVNDAAAEALADGLPPFEEVIVKSSYQTELDEPSSSVLVSIAGNPCSNSSYLGFEESLYHEWPELATAVCHVPIDLSPQFVDFNGDGYLDLAVLQRDDPDLLWTGDRDWLQAENDNDARTRVWIQTPNGSQRWTRAPQYDLPLDIWPTVPERNRGFAHVELSHEAYSLVHNYECFSWEISFQDCGPNTITRDMGVRLADLNGDGLTDVVWKGGFGGDGVLLNTGGDSDQFSAWCASDSEDAPLVGSHCAEAAAYIPPLDFIDLQSFVGNSYASPRPVGMLADLNGDGFLDFVQRNRRTFEKRAWIQSPGGATADIVWRRDLRFDFPVNSWSGCVTHPQNGDEVCPNITEIDGFIPSYRAFDIDGDGSADLVGDQYAFLSRSRHSDLVRSVDNGRGGLVEVEYDSTIRQRDSELEAVAEFDAEQPETPEGGDATLWRPRPVVSSVRVTAPNSRESEEAVTDSRYARPRFCTNLRVDLGFRLVEKTRPDASTVEEYFHQDHGRAGRTSKRLVKDAGQVVQRYQATWEQVTGPIPGSISEVFLGRLALEESANEYGGASGASHSRIFTYDDAHGYNFVSQIEDVRPTGTLRTIQVPVPVPADPDDWLVRLVAERRQEDGSGSVLSRSTFSYTEEGRLETRTDDVQRRDGTDSLLTVTTDLGYDTFGNLIQRTEALGGADERVTAFCYDGGAGCPVFGSQDSQSVLVRITDPAGKDVTFEPDAATGEVLVIDSDYDDEPRIRRELDPFDRVKKVHLTPLGGQEFLRSETDYNDYADPTPAVVRRDYTTDSDYISSTTVSDGFGGVWRTFDENPSGADKPFRGAAVYRDPVTRVVRETYPIACSGPITCSGITGEDDTPATVTTTDALGRPTSIATPDGTAIIAYGSEERGGDRFDTVLHKNGAGHLSRRLVDGDRVVWVDECSNAVPPGTISLDGVACEAPDQTFTEYEPTGEIATVYDAVATSPEGSMADPHHYLRYHYDTRGQVRQIDDPDGGTTFTTYDPFGNVDTVTNARNQVTDYDHDELDRLTLIQPDVGGGSEANVVISYDPDLWSRKQVPTGSGVSTTYEYDDLGRERRSVVSVWGPVFVTDVEYDRLDRIAKIVYPSPNADVTYEYDGAYLKSVCGRADGDCASNPDDYFISEVVYDDLGRPTEIWKQPGVVLHQSYDPNTYRLATSRLATGADQNLLKFTYSYDQIGNVETVLDDHTAAGTDGLDASASYEYDSRNRLTRRTIAEVTKHFKYDRLGNLTGRDLDSGEAPENQFFQDPQGRPHAISSRAGGAPYEYDADGNMTRRGWSQYLTYDSQNRLVCVGTASGACDITSFFYHDGERLAEPGAGGGFHFFIGDLFEWDTGSNTAEAHVYAFGQRIATQVSTNASLRSAWAPASRPFPIDPRPFLWGLGILATAALLAWLHQSGAIAMVRSQPATASLAGVLIVAVAIPVHAGGGGDSDWYRRWLHNDRLASAVIVTNESGDLIHRRVFEPFGQVIAETSDPTEESAQLFTGQTLEGRSGLYDFQARWYDPDTGTFLSVDPVVADARDPQAYNAYAYVRNNPVRYVDPTGMAQFECFGNCAGASGAPPGWAPFPTPIYTATYTQGPFSMTWQATASELAPVADYVIDKGGNVSFSTDLFFSPSGPGLGGVAGLGGLSPSGASAVGDYASNMARGELLDVFGGISGTLSGIVTGFVRALGGAFTLNARMLGEGLMDLGGALSMPRLGSHGGLRHPGSSPALPESGTKPNNASIWHDDFVGRFGYWNSAAQFGWIRRAWAGPGVEPGPYGQAYRILGTVGFGIAGALQWATGD